MTSHLRPTPEAPLWIGPHKVYYIHPRVDVAVMDGELSHEHLLQLWAMIGEFGGHCVAMVRDAQKLGNISPQARRFVVRHGLHGLGESGVELRLYLANVNTVTRALVRIMMSAIRVVSKRPLRVIPTASFEEAVTLALAYAEEIDEKLGPVRLLPS